LTYARELALALAELGSGHQFVSFVNSEAGDVNGFWRELGSVVRLPASPRRRPVWAWLETTGVPVAAARARVDLLHSPANLGPLAGPFARVLTVHDLLFRRHPEYLTPLMRAGTELLLPRAARRAHELITVSRTSRDDIIRLLGVPADRVAAIPNGWTPPRTRGDAGLARERFQLGDRPVALSVASDLPHKDLGVLVDALRRIPREERPLLVFAGHGTDRGTLPAQARAAGVEDDTALLGGVDPATLEHLYAAAALVVASTRAEGFGLPVIEAFGRGIPVACSDLPVLREVAGDLAQWFRPGDAQSAADAIRRGLEPGRCDEGQRAARMAHAAQFSWRTAAERTAAVYEAALTARGSR
jgi:glycosyltransferase involved in cell wall biosynthesis